MSLFKLHSEYKPNGGQPKAIKELLVGLADGKKSQMLFGVTGSGKTFTMANVIAVSNRPALIMVHNKTLAAQIYSELKSMFPENAVEYFVSYYDYYQPEAYISRTDTYIEKDSSINEQIDLLRHSATRSLIERRDVIVVSSVSCIYGLGSPELYSKMSLELKIGKKYKRKDLLEKIVGLHYVRNDLSFERGSFRICGELIDIFPSHYSTRAWRLLFFEDELENINEFDPVTGKKYKKLERVTLYSSSHFVTPVSVIKNAIANIEIELEEQLTYLKPLEYKRLKQKTWHDIEMLQSTGTCKGIENYSRFLTGREAGDPPPTLFEYLPQDALLFVDESHVMVPQIRAMYNGDRARKCSLVEHGFRLPSALDNRPLKFEEWMKLRPQTIFVSATPSLFEIEQSKGVIVELLIRPTGLLDPECIVRPATNQVEDLIDEIKITIEQGFRILITTLTKKMSEDLSVYLQEIGYQVGYLHSDIQTLERIEIIKNLRKGEIKVIVGVNLLREGLDIPECALVAILDADKEGFLRSETSLIQTIGRASRNSKGRVLLYADNMTDSIKKAIQETLRRRKVQQNYNAEHKITPKTITSKLHDVFKIKHISNNLKNNRNFIDKNSITNPKKISLCIDALHKKMHKCASNLEFEEASKLRDQIVVLKKALIELT